MNTIVELLNTAGRRFVEFSLPMFIQAGVLILVLLAVDVFLKRRVRAVFRYWIWMLVLVKLVLPPSLGSPVSVGTWFGDTLDVPTASLLEPDPPQAVEPQTAELSPVISAAFSQPDPMIAQPLAAPPATRPTSPTRTAETRPPVETPAVSLSWQGLLLVIWAAVVLALTLLLIQRAFFVRGLLGQSEEASQGMLNEMEHCRRRLGLRRAVGLRLSPNATSPAVCGLLKPVILIPQSIAPRLQSHDLQAVLLHELAHVKRGDLWVNLVQTLLQIAYFYNPLLWLANAMIRRTREQAVDETVLVAMGETARQYPEILVNIAKLAFTRRPALSLRLIGVVESKSALTARIKHILTRPLPKTARLSLLGLLTILIIAAILLPMARAAEGNASVDNQGPLDIRLVGVRPDGGDELYDANGRKLSAPNAFLGNNGGGSWNSEDQQRDFVLQTPQLSEPLLFLHTWIRTAGTDRTAGGGSVYSAGMEDPSTLIVSSTLDREYRRLGGMIMAPTAPVARVDLPLKYFYGKPRDTLCTFTGPFVPGKAVQADAGRPFQLTPEAVEYGDGTLLKFRFSTDKEFEGSTWMLAYDKQGRRYLLDGGQDAQRYHGIDRPYQTNAIPWDQISVITVGEKAYEITFRNVVVGYPGRPPRTHAAYLDVMAQRLGLTGMSSEQLRQYTVKNPQEAIAVLDVVRGEWHIRTTFEVLERARPPIRVSELDAATQQKIREVAARWAHSASVSQYGIQLGLMGQWPEFFDMAMDRIGTDYSANRLHYYYEKAWLEANRQIAYTLSTRWTELNTRQVERIKHLILDAPGDRAASNWLFWCLRNVKSQGVVDALWELAQDERPWIWWSALDTWYNQTARTRSGYEDLPEKIRVRLSLVEDIRVDEALKAKASALLARILTPDVMGLSSGLGDQICRKVMEELDRETITQIFVESLRAMQSAITSRQWLVDYPRRSNFTSMTVRMIQTLNVWYGVDIGRLGTDDAAASGLEGPQTFAGFQALIAEALEWHRVSRGLRPLEMVLEGRVVDTSGRPVPAAELSLTSLERDGDGYRNSDNPQVVHGRTDADGRFVFKSPANTHHMLRVVAEGFAAREHVSVAQRPDGRFYVPEGAGDNVIVLEKPSSLSGLLLGLDGRPMAGALVHLWSYPAHAVPWLGQRVVDEQGRFSSGAIMSGYHLVRYGERKQADGAQEYEGVTAFSLVHVPEGEAVGDVVLDLRQSTAALEIEIVGPDGQPVGVDELALRIDIPSGKPRHAAVMFLENLKPRRVHRFPNLSPMEGYVDFLGRSPKQVPVKLVANQTTRCRVEIDANASVNARLMAPTAGPQANTAAHEVVLPAANQQPTVFDLATGELCPMPPGPEPQKVQQALLESGKGDILYDVDLGDRTLIFLRDARSEPAGDDTGEPSVTGHLIKNLPETITVVTKEGRRYEVTILAADEKSCTIKYSLIPADRGAGRGASVEPEPQTAAKLPNGATVEFLGLHDCGGQVETWWRPDGEVLPDAPYGYSPYLRSTKPNDTYEALFRISSPTGRAFANMEWTGGRSAIPGYLHRNGRRGSADISDDDNDLFTGVMHGSPEMGQVRIDIGVGLDNAWEPLGVLDDQASQAVTLSDAVIKPAREEGGKIVVTVTHRVSDREVRLVAVDKRGFAHEAVGCRTEQGSGIATYEPRFELPLAEISRFRLETQKLTWMAFKEVSLRPGQKTELRTVLPVGDRESTSKTEPAAPTTGSPSGVAGAIGPVANLPNGATVELVGIRDSAGGDESWWRPDGEAMSAAPYDSSGGIRGGTPNTMYEALVRIDAAGGKPFAEMKWSKGGKLVPTLVRGIGYGSRPRSEIPRDVDDLFYALLGPRPEANPVRIDVGVGLDSAWELLGALDGRDPNAAVTLPGAVIQPAREEDGKTRVTVSHQFPDRAVRLIAVDRQGFIRQPRGHSYGLRDDGGTCEATFELPLAAIQEIRLETQKLAWVTFENVSLQRGQKTEVQIDIGSKDSAYASAREIVLPELDKRPVVLDLATGELIPLPPVGPEPEKILKVFREMGKGDFLYDVDLGDRTLIFLRDAKSMPPGEDTGEPSVTGHLIKNLPETITVVTKEGRRYKVTVLAVDEKSCTLKYSPIPADRGVSGGAPVEPKLKYDVMTKWEDHVRVAIERAAADGDGMVQGDFEWFPGRLSVEDKTGFPRVGSSSPLSQYLDTDETRADSGGGTPIEMGKMASSLELRIVPTRNELALETIAEYRKSLTEGRTPADSRFLWFPVRPGTNPPPGAVAEMHAGKLWLLVHNAEPFIMVPSQGWKVAYADRATDQSGRSTVKLQFDSAGAERLLQLTKANDNHPLAMIVNGVVVSAPNISSGGTGLRQALIPGNFTDQEIEDLIVALRNDVSSDPAKEPRSERVDPVDQFRGASVYLPDLEKPGANTILDLGTREFLSAEPMGRDPEHFDKLGKGDIAYEWTGGKSSLLCFRGTRILEVSAQQSGGRQAPKVVQPDTQRRGFVVYFIDAARRYRVATARGEKYELNVISIDKGDSGGALIEIAKIAALGKSDVGESQSGPQTQVPAPTFDKSLTTVLPNGVTVTLLGLFTGQDMERLEWWYPDGTPAPAERFAEFHRNYVYPLSPLFRYGYLIQFGVVPDMAVQTVAGVGAENRWLWHSSVPSFAFGLVMSDTPQFETELPSVGDIRVIVGTGAYKAVEKSYEYGAIQDVLTLDDGHRLVLSTPRFQPFKGLAIDATTDADNLDLRLRCVSADKATRVVSPHLDQKCQTAGHLTSTGFALMPDDDNPITRISLDYRPADVAHFHNVSLHRGQKADVQVEVRPAQAGRAAFPAARGPGPLGRCALSFDGVDDCLIVPASPSLAIKSPFTVAMWFKPDPVGEPRARMTLMQQGHKPDDPKMVQAGGFWIVGGRGWQAPGAGSLFVGQSGGRLAQRDMMESPLLEQPGWAYLCTRCDDGDYASAEDEPLWIGDDFVPKDVKTEDYPRPFRGQIAEIRIWNKALTEAEAEYYRSSSLTGNEPNLVACWTFDEGRGQIVHDISPNANHARLGSSVAADDADPAWVDLRATAATPGALSGRVVDPNGLGVAKAQVALITAKAGVTVDGGVLLPARFGRDGKAQIIVTDGRGRFRFENEPNEGFSVIAAHDAGFAIEDSNAFKIDREVRLAPWGRVEGEVAEDRHSQDGPVLMSGLPNGTWNQHKHQYLYQGRYDSQGRFVFSNVPAGWFEVGYLVRTGDSSSSFTSRTPVVVRSGETTQVKLGGEGRPVIGRFVPPAGYGGAVYFGEGLRALSTWRPDPPRPADYDKMTKRQQQDWYNQWRRTPEAQAFYEAIWHNPNWRQYAFRINNDGTFRIEDVIAGKYTMTVYLEKEPGDRGPPEEALGGYSGTVEVPLIPGGKSDEPLDLGDLVLRMNEPPLKAGETAPLFEARSVDGKDVRLADYRGKFVLLSFWQPVSNPELERLKELYRAYGASKLQIIGLGGNDTREEVESFVREHKIEWPEVYVGETWDSGIARQYRNPVASYIVLVDPEGKIVATWIRGEELTKTVQDAIAANDSKKTRPTAGTSRGVDPNPAVITRENLYAVARAANYRVGPEWFQVAESADNHIYQSVQRYAERCGEPGFYRVLDDWVRWKYKLDAATGTSSATALFAKFCEQFDRERKFDARQGDPRIRAIGLICDKLDTQVLMDRFVKAIHTRKSFNSSCDDDVDLSIDDRRFTGHDGDVLPASLSAVWYALRRIDEELDRRDPVGLNVIEDELAPILILEYKRQDRPELLDRAVLLGGPEIAEFLLKQDWRDVAGEHNRELYLGRAPWYVNKWLLRLINLDDPAGEKFRRDHPEFVSLFADMWAQNPRLVSGFQTPRFLLLDRDKGTDSFAWRYWPTYVQKAESMGVWFKKVELEFNYLKMLEPDATTRMYADCWIQAIDGPRNAFWNPRQILENVPVPRQRPLATLLVNAIEERLRKSGTWNEQDPTVHGGLESDRAILKAFLDETSP